MDDEERAAYKTRIKKLKNKVYRTKYKYRQIRTENAELKSLLTLYQEKYPE